MDRIEYNATDWIGMIFFTINAAIMLAIIGLSIYGLILFIKLAKRGIRALDIYIQKNKEEKE